MSFDRGEINLVSRREINAFFASWKVKVRITTGCTNYVSCGNEWKEKLFRDGKIIPLPARKIIFKAIFKLKNGVLSGLFGIIIATYLM